MVIFHSYVSLPEGMGTNPVSIFPKSLELSNGHPGHPPWKSQHQHFWRGIEPSGLMIPHMSNCSNQIPIVFIWLVVDLPLWKIWVREWEGSSHILWKIKNVSNHQPVMLYPDLFNILLGNYPIYSTKYFSFIWPIITPQDHHGQHPRQPFTDTAVVGTGGPNTFDLARRDLMVTMKWISSTEDLINVETAVQFTNKYNGLQ